MQVIVLSFCLWCAHRETVGREGETVGREGDLPKITSSLLFGDTATSDRSIYKRKTRCVIRVVGAGIGVEDRACAWYTSSRRT